MTTRGEVARARHAAARERKRTLEAARLERLRAGLAPSARVAEARRAPRRGAAMGAGRAARPAPPDGNNPRGQARPMSTRERLGVRPSGVRPSGAGLAGAHAGKQSRRSKRSAILPNSRPPLFQAAAGGPDGVSREELALESPAALAALAIAGQVELPDDHPEVIAERQARYRAVRKRTCARVKALREAEQERQAREEQAKRLKMERDAEAAAVNPGKAAERVRERLRWEALANEQQTDDLIEAQELSLDAVVLSKLVSRRLEPHFVFTPRVTPEMERRVERIMTTTLQPLRLV